MPQLASAPAERIADHFVNYLFQQYSNSLHVRRVASWVGLIVLGIEKVASARYVPRERQLRFDYNGRTFKATFNHRAGGSPRGGIDIIEILPGRGSPAGPTVHSITNLQEAADFYDHPAQYLP
jgi:hypothetical protein